MNTFYKIAMNNKTYENKYCGVDLSLLQGYNE